MREKSFTALILALLILLFFYDIVFLGKTLSTSSLLPGTTPAGPYEFSGYRPQMPFSFDPAGNAWVNEPGPYIIRLLLDKGRWPSWNPYEGLGIPLIANLNTEVFNPLKLFLNLCPGPFIQDMFFLLRLLVMGIFTYLFLKERKLSPAACFLGSSFFMLSGYSVWWVNLHPLSTVTYLPAVFYFYEKWSEKGDSKSAFLTSLFISFAFTAGKIPDVILGLSLLFLYAIWKGILKDSVKGLFREGGKVMAVSISGALMAAAALLPFFELYSHASPLARAIRTGAASHTIPLLTSVSLFQPLFLGWGNYFYGSWLKWDASGDSAPCRHSYNAADLLCGTDPQDLTADRSLLPLLTIYVLYGLRHIAGASRFEVACYRQHRIPEIQRDVLFFPCCNLRICL